MIEHKMDKRFIWILSITTIIANFLDLLTTIIALNLGRIEGNPLMAYLIFKDLRLFILVKLIVITYLVLPVKYCPIGFLINKKGIWEKAAAIVLIALTLHFSWLWISNLLKII